IVGLASIGTANTLLVNTLERSSEIGTMRALGLTKHQVKKMIVGEGLLVGISGVIGGIIIGVILIYVTSHSSLLEGFIFFNIPLANNLVALFIGILLRLFASWIAATTTNKIKITSSLKEESIDMSVNNVILTLLLSQDNHMK